MSLAIVILAEESGAAWGSRRAKALHSVGGKALVAHVLAAAAAVAGTKEIFVAAGEPVKALLTGASVAWMPSGGALAWIAAQGRIGEVLAVPGDLGLLRPETLERLLLALRQEGTSMVAYMAQGEASGIFALRASALSELPSAKDATGPWGEGTLREFTSIFESAGAKVSPVEAYDPLEVLGARTMLELPAMDSTLRRRTAERAMLNGVTIWHPQSCVIDAGVEVGPDTVIEPQVQLRGKTRIGSNCLIRSGTVIENSSIADNVLIRQYCVITDSEIGSGAQIGPFAHLRPGSEIGEEAHVGNFVETKKARLGRGAKANHLSYLGDAVVGPGANIGAGVITCNYDGVHKHLTSIGAGAFVGSDSTLVAPVSIGEGAYIGAGSCITQDVPADALSVARGRQVNKAGWARAKRESKG